MDEIYKFGFGGGTELSISAIKLDKIRGCGFVSLWHRRWIEKSVVHATVHGSSYINS